MTLYRSYLIRWWDLQSGERRIEVEHVQSGVRAVVATIEAAAGWIATHGGEVARQEAEAGEQGGDDATRQEEGPMDP